MSIPILVAPRASGKTTQATKWLAEDPEHRVVVVSHQRLAEVGYHNAKLFFPDAPISASNFVSARSFLNGINAGATEVWIDQADNVLKTLFGAGRSIAGASWDSPEEEVI
jgi:hypothetical protein